MTERAEYEFRAMDMGNVMHMALERFAVEVRKEGLDWAELTEEERNQLIDSCLDQVSADYGNTVLKSSARNEYMIERTRRILRRTVWALQEQLKRRGFRPEGFEVIFGGGRIDRVDIMEDAEKNRVYVKVIDYKTGNTSFDLLALYHGLQLQLMIYLDGALQVEQKKYPDKEIVPAGVFYYNVKDPMIQEKIHADVESVSDQMLKKLKMNGLVQADDDVSFRIDNTLSSIPVSVNKDGASAGVLLLHPGSSLMRWVHMFVRKSVISGNRSWMEMRQWNLMNLEKRMLAPTVRTVQYADLTERYPDMSSTDCRLSQRVTCGKRS